MNESYSCHAVEQKWYTVSTVKNDEGVCLFHLRPSRRASSTDSYGVPANCPDCPAGLVLALPCCCSLTVDAAASSASIPAEYDYTLCRKVCRGQAVTCTSSHSLLLIANSETMSRSPRMLNIWSKTCLRHHTVLTLQRGREHLKRSKTI